MGGVGRGDMRKVGGSREEEMIQLQFNFKILIKNIK